jgi:hypothetical protein
MKGSFWVRYENFKILPVLLRETQTYVGETTTGSKSGDLMLFTISTVGLDSGAGEKGVMGMGILDLRDLL